MIGGPEVSHETDRQEICDIADYVITGEADLEFARLCQSLLAGRRPLLRVIPARLPEFDELELPYDFYDGRDIAQRVVYVEASRGCPFKCEFCLSSLDVPVRNVPLDRLLAAMRSLLDRGLRQFKFVDRTFNLNLKFSESILRFFLDRYEEGMFLHFEMIPDRLPEQLRELIARFPAGALQFEVGVQSLNDEVTARISRRQDVGKLADNLAFLREKTGVHVHADLIVGLPGEDIDSFGRGFDRLVAMRPQEIQVGILKRLRGTPIVRHDAAYGMVYSPAPPYEVLQTAAMDFSTVQRLRRFSRYWDLIANSGNFVETTPMIWGNRSAFWSFLSLSDWLYARLGRNHAIALPRLAEEVFRYLIERPDAGKTSLKTPGIDGDFANAAMFAPPGAASHGAASRGDDGDFAGADLRTDSADGVAAIAVIAAAMWRDYGRGGRREKPEFLKPWLGEDAANPSEERRRRVGLPKRQARRLM